MSTGMVEKQAKNFKSILIPNKAQILPLYVLEGVI